MRELHFYSYDCLWNPWLGGGGSIRDLEMLRRYTSHFSKITLFVGSYPNAKDFLWENSIYIKHLGPPKPYNEWSSRLHYIIQSNKHIKKSIKQSPPHLIGFSVSPYSPFFGLYHRPTHFGVLHHYIGKHWFKKLPIFGIFPYLFEKWYYKKPTNLIILNQDSLSFLNTFRTTGNYYLSQNSYASSLLQISDTKSVADPFVLYVGRLDIYMKGLDILIEAFHDLLQHSKKFSHWKLVLAGRSDDSSTKALNQLLSKYSNTPIQVIQNPTNSKKEQLLSKCQFFCSPSRFEGWGIAALEANAAGKPCLVSTASGFLSSIGHKISGEHIEIKSPTDLEKALQKWLENPEYVQKLSNHSRKWAKQFSWDTIAKKEWEWIQQKALNLPIH